MKRSLLTLQVAHSAELEALHKLLHFPEEVALRLAESEYHLFHQVPPIDYLRQVTLDLGGNGGAPGASAGSAPHPSQATFPPGFAAGAPSSSGHPSVRSLIKRFNEVNT